MILIGVPGFMLCDEPGCAAQQPASLFISVSGGTCFKPTAEDCRWQVLAPAEGNGPLMSRCPLHRMEQSVIQPGTLVPESRRIQ